MWVQRGDEWGYEREIREHWGGGSEENRGDLNSVVEFFKRWASTSSPLLTKEWYLMFYRILVESICDFIQDECIRKQNIENSNGDPLWFKIFIN